MGTWVELFSVETSKTQEIEGKGREKLKEFLDGNFHPVKTPEIPEN